MELLTEIWDKTTDALSAVSEGVSDGLVRLFGNSNERQIRRMRPVVARINELEPAMQALTDDELRAKTDEFRERLAAGETLDDLLPEAFAACREAGRRTKNMRHYDVQIIGGIVLHGGNIAEMVTGEGKTLVATLPAYLNALDGQGRPRRHRQRLPRPPRLRVDAAHLPRPGHDRRRTSSRDMDPADRRQAYECDITYGTNSEFGFDYLRDNMKPASTTSYQCQQVQRAQLRHHRRGGQHPHRRGPDAADHLRPGVRRRPQVRRGRPDRPARCKKDVHFEVKEKERTCHLTDEGIRKAERLAGVESFYTAGNMEWPHLIDNALQGAPPLPARPRLRRHATETARSSSSTSSPAG